MGRDIDAIKISGEDRRKYRDKVRRDDAGAWRYAQRIVVCDSQRIDTLLAIPL